MPLNNAQRNLIRALDQTYHKLVEVEGIDPTADAVLNQVSELITTLCPDQDEYTGITSHARPIRDKHDHAYSYMVSYVAAPVISLSPSEFGVDPQRSAAIVHENAMDWFRSVQDDHASAGLEMIEVVSAECYTDPLHCEVGHTLGLAAGQNERVYQRPITTQEEPTQHDNDRRFS